MKIFQKIALYIVTIAFCFSQVLEANAYYLNSHSQGSSFASTVSKENKVVNMVMDHISTQSTEHDFKKGVVKVGMLTGFASAVWGLAAYFAWLFSKKRALYRTPGEKAFDSFANSAWMLV
ncbi:hypothetical protein [Bartonella taylorii]|uniref:hypothetical protein n=1 Tax=Bartonella taylorii TaxID=33046 RepID=UPI001ABA5233|nr:hypothetical protein [Bartonella taylorii]